MHPFSRSQHTADHFQTRGNDNPVQKAGLGIPGIDGNIGDETREHHEDDPARAEGKRSNRRSPL
jgi:hypothetical protein